MMKHAVAVMAIAMAAGLAAGTGRAATYTWNLNVAGPSAWNDNASWSPNTGYPNAIDDIADVNNDISANNAISMGAAVSVGTLNIGDASGANTFTINAGSALTFDVSAGSAALTRTTTGTGADTISTGVTLNDPLMVTINSANGSLTIGGVISGANALTKAGAGKLTLSGANSFSGQLSIENGTVFTTSINNKSVNGVLGAGTLVALGASGQTGRLAIQVDAGISSTKDFTLATGGTGEIQFGNLGNFDMTNADRPLTLSGTIGGSGNFVKLGGSPVVLSASNTYSGTTTVSVGPLRLNHAYALPGGIGATGGASALTINGTSGYGAVIELTAASGNFLRGLGTGIDQFQITGGISGFSARGGARQVIVGNNAAFELVWGIPTFNPSVLQFGYTATTDNATTLQNKIDLNGATRTITVIANTATLSGDIRTSSGTAGITKTGGGTLVLSGANTYNGPTTISAGTLSVGAAANLGTGGSFVFTGGTLQYTGAGTMSLSGRPIVWTPGTAVTFNVSGGGTLVIDQSYNGVTTLSAGTLHLNDSGFMTLSLINNGTFVVNKSGTATQGIDIPSIIYGTGRLINSGSGTLILNSPHNFYTGTTKATAGVIQLSHPLAIQNSAIDTTGAGAFTLSGVTAPTIGGLSGASGDLASVMTTGYSGVTNLTLNPSGTVTYGGVIADNSGMTVTKTGAGTQVLQGANTYSGATYLNAGTLEFSGPGSILDSALTFGGGGLKLSNTAAETGSGRVSDSATVTANGGMLTYSNASGANVYAETIGSVALTSGQLDVVEAVNQAGAGSQTLTLSGLTNTGSGTVTFSAATTAPNATKNMIVVTGASGAGAGQNLPGGMIIGPWATAGTAANAQTDCAVHDASGYILPANITTSAEDTWTNSANAYSLSIAAKTAAALTATRNITALKESSTATAATAASGTFTVASGHSLAVGDPVVLGGGIPSGLYLDTVYYVASVPSGTTFTLAATPGGAAINANGSPTFTGGLKLDSGTNLCTFGILNAGTAAFGIGRTAAGGNVTLPTAGAGNLFITPSGGSGSGAISIDAPIVDNSGALTLVKSGSGLLRLSGTNTYTGGTVINAGTVAVTAGSQFGAAGSSITFNGSAALSVGPNANWAFASGGSPDLGSHPIAVNNGAVAGLYYNSPNTTITMSGAITGNGGIIYGRDPVVTFGGGSGGENISLLSTGNTFTGPLTLGVNASENIGTSADFTFNSLADSTSPITFNLGGGWTVSYGTGATANLSLPSRPIDLRNSSATIRNQNGTYTMTLGAVSTSTTGAKTLNLGNGGAGGFVVGAVTDGAGSLSVAKSGTGTWTISGNIRMSGGVSLSGGGTLVLSGTNTWGGVTTFSQDAGTLAIRGTQALATGSKIVMNRNTTLQILTDDSGTVNLGNNIEFDRFDTSSGIIQNYTVNLGNNGGATIGSTIVLGNLDFTKNDMRPPRQLTTTGANGYSVRVGDVFLATEIQGTATGGAQRFTPSSAALTIAGTVKQINGNTGTQLNANYLYLGGAMTGNRVSGTIADADDYTAATNPNAKPLNVYKGDSGEWILSGTNTYTGTTTVNAGTLVLAGSRCLSDTANLTIQAGAKVRLEEEVKEMVGALYFGAVQQATGSWGSSTSAADNKNDTYFIGSGVLYAGVEPPPTDGAILIVK